MRQKRGLMRLNIRTARVLFALMLASCSYEAPQPSLPPEATPLRTPRDIDGVWLDVQESKIRDSLTQKFGRVAIAEYRLDGDWTWEKLCDRFDAELASRSFARYRAMPTMTRHYELAVWTPRGAKGSPMVALAEVEPPRSAGNVSHRVVLVITQRK